MSINLIYFFMGLSLSMDAFSLALSLGLENPPKKQIILLSTIIGVFHFIMPIIGFHIGNHINNTLLINTNYLTSIIFIFLSYEMIKNRNTNIQTYIINPITVFLLPLAVSIDSFTLGIALGLANSNIIIPSIIFSIISFLSTIIGSFLGIKFHKKYHTLAVDLGIIIMLALSIKYIFNI